MFLDESGVHVAMHRTHTWVKRGTEYIERVPMNWGRTLTLLGAMRHTGWVVLQTMFATANADRFVAWRTRHLLPQLHRGDVLVMDNLRAHHDRRVGPACRTRGIQVLYLPPYRPTCTRSSPDGRCRSSTCGSTRHAPPITCDESPAALGIALRPGTVAAGLRMLVTTRLNSGDPWD